MECCAVTPVGVGGCPTTELAASEGAPLFAAVPSVPAVDEASTVRAQQLLLVWFKVSLVRYQMCVDIATCGIRRCFEVS